MDHDIEISPNTSLLFWSTTRGGALGAEENPKQFYEFFEMAVPSVMKLTYHKV